MEKKSSAGLKNYFAVRRRTATVEEDRKVKAPINSSKVARSPSKEVLSVLQSPSRCPSRCPPHKSSPLKRNRDGAPKLERFDFIEFDSPTKKEKRVSLSGNDLPLPKSYQVLAEQFRCTDVIVDMLRRRKETCTFSKLKKAVEDMSGKAFSVKTLAQLKTVYPRSFKHSYQSNVPGGNPTSRTKHQLVIEANMEERALDFSLTPATMATHFTSASFIHRRRIFHRGLIAMVKGHHKEFLATLEPPLEIPDREVLRWHEEFDLESVSEVPEADMPKPPVKDQAVMSAKQLLLSHVMSPHGKKSASSDAAEPEVACKSEKTEDASPKTVTQRGSPVKTGVPGTPAEATGGDSPSTPVTPGRSPAKTGGPGTPGKRGLDKDSSHLRGVSRKLIEKIQEKEAARAKLEIMRGPSEVKELRMIDTSTRVVPILKSFFLLEKKAAVPLHCVVAKIQESLTSQLSQEFIEETLQYLVRAGISWIQIVAIKNRKYVKVDKSADVNVVLKKIEDLKKQHYKVPSSS